MKDTMLKTVSPESVGISSKAINDYIDYLGKRGVNIHSFLMIRHGKICAEGYYGSYTEDKLQRMYSISKTFTSAAIGLMVDEGKIKLTDRIADYFPEYVPENPHQALLDITIEDMLKMAVAFCWDSTNPGTMHNDQSKNWARSFFEAKVTHPSNTGFLYDTAASHVMAALVEKLSGKKMMEYMRDKLFDPIGFSKDAWCIEGPEGSSWGGSGVMATLRDLAKFALVFLNKGKFNGQQLISEEYITKATSKQLDLDVFEGTFWTDYGYQVWIMKDYGFCFRGMGSQHAICVPEKDFIFCCTADNQYFPRLDSLIYEELLDHLVPSITDEVLTEGEDYESLKEKCANLKLQIQRGELTSPWMDKVNGVVYNVEDNPMGVSKIRLSFEKDKGKLDYTTPRGDKTIYFGFGKQEEYLFPETHYYGKRIGEPSGEMYRALSSAAWTDEHKLVILTHTIDEYLGNITMSFGFKDDCVGIMMRKNAEWFFNEYHGYALGKKEV